jgi:hypothetical protein
MGRELVREKAKGDWGHLDLLPVKESDQRSAYFDKGVSQEEENEGLVLKELPGEVVDCVGSGPAGLEMRGVKVFREGAVHCNSSPTGEPHGEG